MFASQPGSPRKLLVLLFAASLALRIGYLGLRGTLGESPSTQRGYREYVMVGERLLEHGTLVSPLILEDVDHRPSALMPPLYSGFVAGVYGLLGVETRAATLVLQFTNALATSLAVVLVWLIANSLAGRRAGWIAAMIAAVNPTLIGYTDFIWDTSVFALGVTVAVWWAQRMGRRNASPAKGFVYGGYLGALALLNPALTLAYPLLALWSSAKKNDLFGPSTRRHVLMIIVGWALILAPWTVRNYVHFGEWMYVRGGLGIEFWLGVCPQAETHGAAVFRSQFPLNNADLQRHIREIGETAFIRESGSRAREVIIADPIRYLRLCGLRWVDFWCGTTWSHSRDNAVDAPLSAARTATTAFLSLELIALLVGIAVRGGLDLDLKRLLVGCGLFCVVYVLTHVQLRYRAPIEPIIAVVLGVVRGRDRRRPGQFNEAAEEAGVHPSSLPPSS